MSASASLCSVCGHQHHQDVKCSICGHKGKGKVYALLQNTESVSKSLVFKAFSASSEIEVKNELFPFVKILRKKIFGSDQSKISNQSKDNASAATYDMFIIDENLDLDSIHVLGFIGDAPVCIGRWRRIPAAGKQEFTTTSIDYIGVVSLYADSERDVEERLLRYIVNEIYNDVKLNTYNVGRVACRVCMRLREIAADETAHENGDSLKKLWKKAENLAFYTTNQVEDFNGKTFRVLSKDL